jgi:DNA-binding beta-propeller fold protein YncE
VWVANEGSDSLTVLDGSSGSDLATLAGILAPHNVQEAAEGNAVWALSGGDQVVALDAESLKVTALGQTDKHPAHVVADRAGNVYVSASGQPSMYAYDARLRPLKRTALAGSPHGMRLSGDGRTAVVANTGSGTVDVLDTQSGTLRVSIPVGPGLVQVAVSDDGAVAYVSVGGTSEVVRVDLKSQAVTHRVRVPHPPAQVLLTASGLLLSADQGTAAEPGSTGTVIDPESMTIRGQVQVGSGPHGLTSDPQGKRAWVTNTFDDTVTELDLVAFVAVRTTPVGDSPNGISYSTVVPTRGGQMELGLPGREDRGEEHSDH